MVGVLKREGLSLGDRCQELLPSGLEESLDCPAGNTHLLGSFFLLFPLEIAEAHRLQLVQSELGDLQLRQRDPGRLEQVEPVHSTAVTEFLRSRHSWSSIETQRCEAKATRRAVLLSVVHMHIMSAVKPP